MSRTQIFIKAIGLRGKKVFVAHEKGNWGPENKESDYLDNPLELFGQHLVCSAVFLEFGEEFKIVVPVSGEEEAKKIFAERVGKGAHVGTRFDFDANHNTFWLLDSNYPVIRPGEWNQNNVCFHK